MKYFILISAFCFSINTYAFFGNSVFPKEVKNQCEYFWSTDGKGIAVGQTSVIIELKDAKGELQEKAYIYLDCKGKTPRLNKPPYFDFDKMTTDCMGLRISRLSTPELDTNYMYAIRSEDLEIKRADKEKIILIWQDASTFEIENGKSFAWTMKSKLSGNTFKGFVACK